MILVTGATGLVGAHLLVQLTRENSSVFALYRTKASLKKVENVFSFASENPKTDFQKIQWLQADITDIPSLKTGFANDITHVYHCAAVISFNPQDYNAMRNVNIKGTANIVNFCIEKNVKKLCHVSSIAAVEANVNQKFIDENEDWNTEIKKSDYAITKYGAEMEVWRGSQEGLKVVVVNPSIILGAGFWHQGSGELFSRVANNLKFYTKGISAFVGVDDVVKAMTQLMQSSIVNERFIVSAENLKTQEVLNQIADKLGKKRPKYQVSSLLLQIAWRLDWLKSFVLRSPRALSRQSASSLVDESFYSSKKLENTLNFMFTPINKVIADVCKEYKKELF